MNPDGMDAGTPVPHVRLHASAWFAAWLLLLATLASVAARYSSLPLLLKSLLWVAACLLLAHAWQRERQAGLRRLYDAGAADGCSGVFALVFADGCRCRAAYAGYALLGSVAIIVFAEREGWRRLLGPRRYTVLRDATDEDSFRRLRAWVRLARPLS